MAVRFRRVPLSKPSPAPPSDRRCSPDAVQDPASPSRGRLKCYPDGGAVQEGPPLTPLPRTVISSQMQSRRHAVPGDTPKRPPTKEAQRYSRWRCGEEVAPFHTSAPHRHLFTSAVPTCMVRRGQYRLIRRRHGHIRKQGWRRGQERQQPVPSFPPSSFLIERSPAAGKTGACRDCGGLPQRI